MNSRRLPALLIWLLAVAVAVGIIARARFSADLSAFLPRTPSPTQQLLVDQLQNGPAAHLILIGIEGGDAAQRAQTERAMTASLGAERLFLAVNDGDSTIEERDRAFVFAHRYELSPGVTPQRFSIAGLHDALEASLDLVNSPAGLLSKSLLSSDPTGETLQIVDQLDSSAAPRREQGVWASPDGARALMVAETRASGSDTDGQAQALTAIRAAFAAAAPPVARLRLLLSGPAVFAVAARATIEHEVKRLSAISSVLIVTLLLLVYRSVSMLLLGLLPVVSGALAGVVAVALGAGVVHGITLGFGTTLIGESVDYSIYLFVQTRRRGEQEQPQVPAHLWPIIGLGMLTSVCGFASLLPSSFPGLQQLGIYSIAGLIAAAAAARWLLPPLLPVRRRIPELAPLGAAAAGLRARVRGLGVTLPLLGCASVALLYLHRDSLWNRDLAALSPVSAADQALDGELRGELGAPDVSNLVIVNAPDQEAALERAERVSRQLDALAASGAIQGYDSPTRYLPSERTQAARRASLPDAASLRERLRAATADLPLRPQALEPFVAAVDAARTAAPLDRAAFAQTSLSLALDALLWQRGDRWYALQPLRANRRAPGGGDIDIARVREALTGEAPGSVLALNIKQETDALYGSYMREAIRLSLYGLGAIVLLLACALRSPARVGRVMAPLALSVLVVSAALVAVGVQLTILHLIGLLLIVAVGSNYALFFDRSVRGCTQAESRLTLASLLVANATTVIGFGVLAFSSVPVLQALGATVAPGALLALWFSAALAPRVWFLATAQT
ncbi:MAG TPA: MMPL family transporter [Steroidobacteraceae bacterium]